MVAIVCYEESFSSQAICNVYSVCWLLSAWIIFYFGERDPAPIRRPFRFFHIKFHRIGRFDQSYAVVIEIDSIQPGKGCQKGNRAIMVSQKRDFITRFITPPACATRWEEKYKHWQTPEKQKNHLGYKKTAAVPG